MQKLAFAVLLPPDQAEASAQALTSCWRGARIEAFQDARRRAGIVKEADDLDIAFTLLKTSAEPFDSWFREHAHHVHGIALDEGFTAPELVLDFDIGTI